MKIKNYLNHLILANLLLFVSSKGVQAQVYANEELRIEADSILALKNQTTFDVNHTGLHKELTNPFLVSKDSYRIQVIDAVNFGQEYSIGEIDIFKSEAQSEFLRNDFFVDFNKNEFVIVNREDRSFYRIYNFNLSNLIIKILCETCSIPDMRIVQMNDELLILDIPNQDEGKVFDFRFTFKKN